MTTTTTMATMKRYPVYKDSGIEWPGEIPAHWETKPIKYCVAINSDSLPENTSADFIFKYVDISNVDYKGSIVGTEEMFFADAPSRARRIVQDGDIIISTVRTYLREIAFIDNNSESFIVSTGFAVLRPLPELVPEFLFRLAQSQQFIDAVVSHSEGVGYPAITPSRLASLPVLLPSLAEQQAIAEYLDRQTAKIDVLIAKEERQIELLKEKRTAIISHAVTKGLNPAATMKDSGIKWLCEIPEHWELNRLKFIAGGITVGVVVNPSIYFTESGVPFLRGNDIFEGQINIEAVKYMSEESNRLLSKSMLHIGDLVSIRVGYPGVTAVIPPQLDGCNCASLMITRRSTRASSQFLCYAMNSKLGKNQFNILQDGAAQEQINISEAVNILIPFPPFPEQQAIAEYLDRQTAKIDVLIAKIQLSVEKLKEYRTALISAAVTGKIDVRGEK
jgi:type I restriction enzyme S subunit